MNRAAIYARLSLDVQRWKCLRPSGGMNRRHLHRWDLHRDDRRSRLSVRRQDTEGVTR